MEGVVFKTVPEAANDEGDNLGKVRFIDNDTMEFTFAELAPLHADYVDLHRIGSESPIDMCDPLAVFQAAERIKQLAELSADSGADVRGIRRRRRV